MLLQIAEVSSVTTNSHYYVLDWVVVINALLALQVKLASPPLPCGRVVVAVSAQSGAQRIALEVTAVGAGQCSAAEAREVADVVCRDELEATRLLLGHLPCGHVMDLSCAEAEAGWLLDAWCPLPIHWNKQDAV